MIPTQAPYKIIGFFEIDATMHNSLTRENTGKKERAKFYVIKKKKTFLCFGKKEIEILLKEKQKEITLRDKEIKRLRLQILKDNFIILKLKEKVGRN